MTRLSIARYFRERATTYILRISTTVFELKMNTNDVHLMAIKFPKKFNVGVVWGTKIYLSQTLLTKEIKICPRVWRRQFVHSNYTEKCDYENYTAAVLLLRTFARFGYKDTNNARHINFS